MSDTEKNYPGSEKKDGGKKKDGKRDKKEKGYVMFEDGSDEELMAGDDLKSPSKMKKGKAFRFAKKDIFPKVKEDKKEKEGKKEEKEKKEGKKHKLKVKKKSKHHEIPVPKAVDKPVFGVALSVALERNRSHDGIQLPALFRECIDYIEIHGLSCEGIYRISGVKSKVQHLKDSYNRADPVFLEEHEPNIVASVLKLFLRELPDPVLTNALIPKFEEASTIRNERRRIEGFLKLIQRLPEPNRLLLSWMIVHMTHVIERQKENKMTLQNVSIVLSPTMQISHRVLNVLFSHTKQLFKDTVIKRYVPPLKPATSKWSLELPDNPQALSEELLKQESLLNQLHEELAAGKEDPEKEEQIWEVQRICTQLKRKIKTAQKNQDTLEKRRKERDEQSKRNTVLEEGEEELNLELREIPSECQDMKLELKQTPSEEDTTPKAAKEDTAPPTSEAAKTTAGKEKDSKEKEKVTLKELATKGKGDDDKGVPNVTDEGDGDAETVEDKAKSDENEKQAAEVEDTKESDENKDGVDKDKDSENVKDDKNVKTDKIVKSKKNVKADKDLKGSRERIKSGEQVKTVKAETGEDDNAEKSGEDVKKGSEEVEIKTETEKVSGQDEGGENVEEGGVEQDEDKEDEEEDDDNDIITADDVREEIKKKEALMMQEDTTDSEMGKSQEDIQGKLSDSEDEFENSLEEILERDLNEDSDKEQELTEEEKSAAPADETQESSDDSEDETIAMDTKTPVPAETPESPPTTTTPVPGLAEEQTTAEITVESDVDGTKTEEVVSVTSEDESFDEEEYQALLEKMYELKLEEEELLAIESELHNKIATERCETERLQQELDEIQYLRQDSDEEVLSTSSDSSYESEDEDDLQEILNQLIKENEELEKCNSEMCGKIHEERMICLDVKKSNSEMCGKIHEERMICLDVKVQIGILQQKQAQNSANSGAVKEDESLIEFD